jgi:hypothetical protein
VKVKWRFGAPIQVVFVIPALIVMIPLLERMPGFLLDHATLRHADAVAGAVLDGIHHFIRFLG